MVNIEVNTAYSLDDLTRNFAYLCKLHGQNLLALESYIYQDESVQINLNFGQEKNADPNYEYILYDPVHTRKLNVKFKYMEINLDKYYDFWYHKVKQMIKENPMLIAISIKNKDELDKYVDYIQNKDVKKVRDMVEKLNKDDRFASELSYNERQELKYAQLMAYRFEQGIEQGIEQGEEKGKEEGKNQAKIEMANGLIIDGFSNEKVAKYTKLSLEEIQKLRSNIAK